MAQRDVLIRGSDMTTIMYVLDVNSSMNAVKFEFRTSMLCNCVCVLLETRGRREAVAVRIDVQRMGNRETQRQNNQSEKTYTQLSLNCLIMLEIFSKR